MKKAMFIAVACLMLLVTASVALAANTWNVGYGYNRGYGRQGTLGKPFAGTYRPVDTWNVGYGMDRGYGRHATLGRYGDGYKRFTDAGRVNDYAWTGVASNFNPDRAQFSTFGRKSYNPEPRAYTFGVWSGANNLYRW